MNGIAATYGYLIKPGIESGVVFSVQVEVEGQRHNRVVPVTIKSAYAAELAAVKYALSAVDHKSDVDMLLIVHSKNLPAVFFKKDNGDWKKNYSSNNTIINEIRVLSNEFKSFKCQMDREHDFMVEIKDLAKKSRDLVLAQTASE